jgi:outer membrane protein
MKTQQLLVALMLGVAITAPARADSEVPRHWIARIGIHPVQPKPDGHREFEVDGDAGFSLGVTYLFSKHWALELFAAFPRAHELHDGGGARAGSFEMIPATATVQYHISDAAGRMRAYVGLGVGHASIGSERTRGSLAQRRLDIDDASGVAAAVGLDMDIGRRWFVNIDGRWIDLDSTLQLDGRGGERFVIDPFLFGLSIGRRLR